MITTDFRIQELQNIVTSPEDQEAWEAMVKKIGMDRLLNKDEKDVQIIPYLKCSLELKRSIDICCERSSEIAEYDHDQPPMEALGLIFFAKEAGYFEEIKIKYDDIDPDPIAIGIKNNDTYLIAAWGPENVTPEQLIERAWVKLCKKIRNTAKRLLPELQAAVENPENIANNYMRNKYFREIWLR